MAAVPTSIPLRANTNIFTNQNEGVSNGEKLTASLQSVTAKFTELDTGEAEGSNGNAHPEFILNTAQKHIAQFQMEYDALERKQLRESLRVTKCPSDFVLVLADHLGQSKIQKVREKHVKQIKELLKELGPKPFEAATGKCSAKNFNNLAGSKCQKESILICACSELMPWASEVIVEALLKAHVDPNERDSFLQTALMHAANQYDLRLFEKLIHAEGADVNLQATNGTTALMIVARSKYTGDGSMAGVNLKKMLSLLLKKKANPDLQEKGKSALDLAVDAENFGTVKALITITSPNKYNFNRLVDYLLDLYKRRFERYQECLTHYRNTNTASSEENIKRLRSEDESDFSDIQYCLEKINETISSVANIAIPMGFSQSKPLQKNVSSINETLKQLRKLLPESAQVREENRLSTCDI